VPDGDSLAIAMQYALGGSLADRLSRHGRLSPAQVVALASRCVDALASAHRRGVLHRDVKPANILFTSDGEPLLSDFGVARWGGRSGLTGDGMTLGTAGYIDPAVVDGAEPSARSDVYSLGVVCYEALVGRPPFRGLNELAVMRAADRGEYTPLSDALPGVPPAVAAVVERAMARNPAVRFADAAEFARALRGVRGVASPSGDDSRPYTPSSVPRTDAPRLSSPSASASGDAAPTGLFGPRPPEPPAPKRPPFGRVRGIRLPRPRLPHVSVRFPRVPRRRAVIVIAVLAVGCVVYAARPHAAVRRPVDRPQATVAGNVIEVRPRAGGSPTRFTIGDAGDVALLGDWHCRGDVTPAIYRPSTGQIFVFDAWADPTRALSSSSMAAAIPNGRPVVVRSAGGCDRIDVRPN
jgi:Protein kinase domain